MEDDDRSFATGFKQPARACLRLCSAALALVLSACSTASSSSQLRFSGRVWKVGHESSTPDGSIVEYVLPHESVRDWTELLTIQWIPQDFVNYKNESLIQEMKADLLRDCPGAFWNTISAIPGEVIFEWRTADCPAMASQHEIARVLFHESGIHRIAYVKKGKGLSSRERNIVVNLLTAMALPRRGDGLP